MGEHDLGKFANNLKDFGTAIVTFTNSLKGADFTTDNVTSAMSVVTRLANVNETLTHSNEFSLQSFTENLTNVPKNLANFINAIQEIELGSAETKIASILDLFRQLKTGLSDESTNVASADATLSGLTESIKNVFAELSSDTSITSSAEGVLTTFAAGITANQNVITDALYNAITAAVGKASADATNDTSVQTSANQLSQNLANAMQQSNTAEISSAAGGQADAALSSITEKAGKFSEAGGTLMSKFNEGLSSKVGVIRSTVSSAVSRAIAAAASYENYAYNVGYTIGTNIGSGAANGISSMISSVASKAAQMVRDAKDAADKEADSHSPSKEMEKRGKWFAQGYAKGIDKDANLATKASKRMVSGSIGILQNTLSTLGSMLSGDLENIQPTISPVVNLSNVRRSANIIGDMLSFDNSLNIMSDLRSINSTMNASRQNGTSNRDIVSELQKLGKILQSIPNGNTYIDGISYSNGSDVANAVNDLIRAVTVGGRV